MIVRTFLSLVLCLLSYAQDSKVTVTVILQTGSFHGDSIVCIAGNRPELGLWSPNRVTLRRYDDSTWKFSGLFPNGTILQFKITNGTWEGEALYDIVSVPRNTIVEVTKDTTVILRPLFWKSQLQRSKPIPTITGTVVYHRTMTGEGLNYARDVIVWLPPSYDKNVTKRYPVLYMHDGQNLFDPSTAFTGYDWRVDEVADSLIRMEIIDEVIVVGLYNTPDRLAEYSESPLGEAYLNFVVNVVKPLIDSAYRSKSDRKHTAVMGSSMGGLSSLIFTWKRPDVFGMAGALSTSFWYDDELTLKKIRDYAGQKKDLRIYLDCGGREKELIGGYRRMVEILKKKGYKKGKDLEYHIDTKGMHSEHSWSKRVWQPLVFMFGKKRGLELKNMGP